MASAAQTKVGEIMLRGMMRQPAILAWLTPLPFDWPGLVARLGRRLTQAGRFDAAESLLAQAANVWPQDGHIAMNHAFLAEARGDLLAYADRWRAISDRNPDLAWPQAGLGAALRKLGRLEQARDVLHAAQCRFPDDNQIGIETAWLMVDLGEHERAAALWQNFAARCPDRFEGPLGQATALRNLRRFDEADAVLLAAMPRFPALSVLAANYAVNADARGDRAMALSRWRRVVEQFPDVAIGYAGVGAALKACGDFADANRVLAEAIQRFPEDANLEINHAWVAEAEQDWPEALARWRRLLTRFPNHPAIRNGVSEAAMKAQLAAFDQANVSFLEHPEPGPADLSRDVLMQFEALGENCELGFVQRHFGAEPLSLLRWAGISCQSLIAALDTCFAGVGDPEHTVMELNPYNHEYFTRDLRYGMNMHSFLHEDSAKRNNIYQSMCRRLTFLKDKLLRELAEAEKIFVYSTAQRMTDQDLHALFGALQRHGPVTLLHVCPSDDPQSAGQVISVQAGLLIGFLDRVGYDGKRWDISFQHWLTVCQRARAMAGRETASV
jgi:tetratricopeptide (TPR) repeat protein